MFSRLYQIKKLCMQIIDIVVVGNTAVGKSSLIENWSKSAKYETGKKLTRPYVKSSDYGESSVTVSAQTNYGRFKLNCFVTMQAPLDNYYDVAIIILDLHNKQSVQSLPKWCECVRKYSPDCKIVICGDKSNENKSIKKNSHTFDPFHLKNSHTFDPFHFDLNRILTKFNAQYCEIDAISNSMQLLPLLCAIQAMIESKNVVIESTNSFSTTTIESKIEKIETIDTIKPIDTIITNNEITNDYSIISTTETKIETKEETKTINEATENKTGSTPETLTTAKTDTNQEVIIAEKSTCVVC